jgi:predicted ATPase
MELIYLYIENDERNIQECQFNFSPKYNCHYDKGRNELIINRNDDYITDFWNASNISNITAIIGKNGTGKSNLLQLLLEHYKRKNIIYIYEVTKQLNLKTNISDLKTNKNLNIEIVEESRVICYPAIYYNPSIYQSISIDNFKEKASIDISEKRMIVKDCSKFIREDSRYANNVWLYHKYGNTLRQLDFLSEYNDLHIDDFKLPKRCFFRTEFLSVFNHRPTDTKANEFYDKIKSSFVRGSIINDRVLSYTPLYATLIFELYCYCRDMHIDFDWEHTDLNVDIIFGTFKQYDSAIGLCLFEISSIIEMTIGFYYEETNHGFYLSVDDAAVFFNKYFKLISLYKNNIAQNTPNKTEPLPSKSLFDSMITVEWEYTMSSGEQMYLNLMSSLCYAKEQLDLKPNFSDLFILLDEPEISFHPEWQRQFVNILTTFIKRAFDGINVQVILTSHSPIIASDFPKNNIIFLDSDENGKCKVVESITRENTFGANIHTLYKNSFFLNGLPIGEFAKMKINNLYKRLQTGETSDDLYKEIMIVGEPLLHKQLKDLYNGNLPNDVNKRITEMEKQIKELKQQLHDKDSKK